MNRSLSLPWLVCLALSFIGACTASSSATGQPGGAGGGGTAGASTARGGSGGEPSTGGAPGGVGGSGGVAAGGSGGSGPAGAGGRGGSTGSGAVGGTAAAGGSSGAGGSAGAAGGLAGTGGQQNRDAGIGDGAAGAGGSPDAGTFAMPIKPVPVNGASTVTDGAASGGSSVGLTGTGQGAQASGLPAASKLAIHYASVSVGTISVAVDNQAARKVNVHSSGALTGSFLYAIIDIDIPAGAKVTISRASSDVAINVDQMIVGVGNLGLPPDIWNLSPFQAASGPYVADWQKLGLAYVTPAWWRDAKLGAWAHWDPQSMPEQGDWYAYRMYQEGSADFNYHVAHFGDPSVYGYKDICQNWVVDQWNPSNLMVFWWR